MFVLKGGTNNFSSVFEEKGWALRKTCKTATNWIGYFESIKGVSSLIFSCVA